MTWRNVLYAVVALGMIVGMGLVLMPIFNASFYPPPDKEWLQSYQKTLDNDGLPVVADTLIDHEIDRGTGLVEGPFHEDWQAFCEKWSAKPVAGKPASVLVKTKEGDFSRLMPLTDDRVRVVTGYRCEEERARAIFDDEMRSGQGRHPAYRAGSSPNVRP